MADLREEPRRESRQQEQDHGGRRAEESQPQIVMREHDAERQHRAEVVDEAGGEDDLAHLGAIEAGLHHHRVDDRDGGRRQRNPGDLRLVPRPMDRVMGVGEHAEIGGEKADDADRYGGAEVPAHHAGIDFRAGEKGEQNRAESGEEIHPFRQREADRVARERADHDFDQRHRNRHANGNDRGDQRQSRSTEPIEAKPVPSRPPCCGRDDRAAGREIGPSGSHHAFDAAGVISLDRRFWGTPSPSRWASG